MSGYNYDTYRSNNAEAAIAAGMLTAGEVVRELKKLRKDVKVDAKRLVAECHYTEKHHTSSRYNWTYYFENEDFEEAKEWFLALPPDSIEVKDQKIIITYPIWGGTRDCPFIEKKITARALKNGNWATLADGSRKKIDGCAVTWIADDSTEPFIINKKPPKPIRSITIYGKGIELELDLENNDKVVRAMNLTKLVEACANTITQRSIEYECVDGFEKFTKLIRINCPISELNTTIIISIKKSQTINGAKYIANIVANGLYTGDTNLNGAMEYVISINSLIKQIFLQEKATQ